LRRDTLNFFVDVLLLLALLGMIATGLTTRYLLPPGSRGGQGLSLWGLDRHEWGDIHFWLAVTLAGLLVLHVALHWSWVCVLITRWLRPANVPAQPTSALRRNLCGLLFLVVVAGLLAAFVWIAHTQVTGRSTDGMHETGGRQRRRGRGLPLAPPALVLQVPSANMAVPRVEPWALPTGPRQQA